MAEDKGHKPTPQKLKKARKDGKVLKSKELTGAVCLSFTILALAKILNSLLFSDRILLDYCIGHATSHFEQCVSHAGQIIVWGSAICVLLTALLGILTEMLQIGVSFEASVLVPKLARLNPVSGIQKVFSSLRTIWLPFVRSSVLLLVFYWFFQLELPGLSRLAFGTQMSFGWTFIKVLVAGCVVNVFFAGADYLLQHRRFYRELSMSTDEIRREHKDQEGDPLFKSQRRSEHEALLRQDVVSRVRKSKVIVVEK